MAKLKENPLAAGTKFRLGAAKSRIMKKNPSPPGNLYTSGKYLEENPSWHAEHSWWKARHILRLIKRHNLRAKTICEVGCGAGEILRELQAALSDDTEFFGFEISPQAFALCQSQANPRLHFHLEDITKIDGVFFDLILLIDLLEHLEDPYSFLRNLKPKSHFKIIHFPLDLSVQAVWRVKPLLRMRRTVGHLHYFNKELALLLLQDTGYEIVDLFYTPTMIDLQGKSWTSRFGRLPRQILFRLHPDLAARWLGGFSLMVLAK